MSDEDVRMFMKEPWVATASDGASMLPGDGAPSRSYGTFPRKIGRYAIADQEISLEQAIRSARAAGGHPTIARARVSEGRLFRDIVVIDPKTFRDKATYDSPHQYATGVRYLFVNGKLAIEDGKGSDMLAGKVLRHGK